tara:strand:+ start:158 stop:400 length:243 start_codon:yes stop_codon:yes gene_type:complete
MLNINDFLLFLYDKTIEYPNNKYNIVHAIPKTSAGGLNFTELPALSPTLHFELTENPETIGKSNNKISLVFIFIITFKIK